MCKEEDKELCYMYVFLLFRLLSLLKKRNQDEFPARLFVLNLLKEQHLHVYECVHVHMFCV